ncbi:MAG: isochorismatase family protein [Anaerolineales bacterium]
MKEAYFTPDNIINRAADFISGCEKVARSKKLAYSAQSSALLVLDMQAYFLDPGSHAYIPSAAAILPGLNELIRAYRGQALPVVFTRHANTAQDGGMMPIWWRDTIKIDNPLSQITPELELDDSPVILKSQYDAFYNTDLEIILRQLGVKRVLICGVMTHLCCETTARSAFMRGFEVFFLVDGTATYNRDFHKAALLNLSHGFTTLMLCAQVVQALENT